uniref:D(4) dopamine receptor-like n=1 Tax=Saccoglossus kowalevskii TaxID=10224 RepID=A0ABM0MWG7_SACKO|nr:PREDICTED: D(4) dopamine receptor-like [Saccoglossus kowalevskii]
MAIYYYLKMNYTANLTNADEHVLFNDSSNVKHLTLPNGWLIASAVMCVATCMFGTFFNVSVCVIVGKSRQLHTPANNQLVALAISDLLNATITSPLWIYRTIVGTAAPDGPDYIVCLAQIFISQFTLTATIVQLATLSLTRALGISGKFSRSTLRCAIYFQIFFSYLLATCVASLKTVSGPAFSCLQFAEGGPGVSRTRSAIVVVFSLSAMIIITSYVFIIVFTLHHRNSVQPYIENQGNASSKIDITTTGICSVLILSFAFLYMIGPFMVGLNLIGVIAYDNGRSYWALSLLTFGSMINPIIYTLMSRKFRKIIRDVYKIYHTRVSVTSNTTAATREINVLNA